MPSIPTGEPSSEPTTPSGQPTGQPTQPTGQPTSEPSYGMLCGVDGTSELSELNGVNGFGFNGEATWDESGYSVSDAGDVNGDGVADVIIGALYADPHGTNSGASYIVFGGPLVGKAGDINLSTLDGTNGVKVEGVSSSDYSGISVSGAGDVN